VSALSAVSPVNSNHQGRDDRGLLGRIHYGEVDYYHGSGLGMGRSLETREKRGRKQLVVGRLSRLDALLFCMGIDVATVSSIQLLPQ